MNAKRSLKLLEDLKDHLLKSKNPEYQAINDDVPDDIKLFAPFYLTARDEIASLERLDGLSDSNIFEVKDSPIHGKGLFALTNINEGTFISFYPCHAIVSGNRFHSVDIPNNTRADNTEFISDYGLHIGNGNFMLGLPYIMTPFMKGHLINDGYKPAAQIRDIDFNDTLTLTDEFVEYTANSHKHNNSILIIKDRLAYVRANRYIKRGEEITLPYSFVYWLNEDIANEEWLHQIFTNLSPSQRQIIQSCFDEQSSEEERKIFNVTNAEFNLLMRLHQEGLLKDNCIIQTQSNKSP